jgi:hypothetical protein
MGRHARADRQRGCSGLSGKRPLPPPPPQAQIDSLRISREPMASIVMAMDAQRRANAQITDPAQKDAAQRPGSRR